VLAPEEKRQTVIHEQSEELDKIAMNDEVVGYVLRKELVNLQTNPTNSSLPLAYHRLPFGRTLREELGPTVGPAPK
jgi:hypothetical protein